jgi:hypothetical protein
MVQYCRFICINLYTFNLPTTITMMEVRDGFPIPLQWWWWEMGSQVISRNKFGKKKTIVVGGECTNVFLTCTCKYTPFCFFFFFFELNIVFFFFFTSSLYYWSFYAQRKALEMVVKNLHTCIYNSRRKLESNWTRWIKI